MPKSFLRFPAILTAIVATIFVPALASANDQAPASQIQEEVWALPLALPVLAYLVRPVGAGPFPLVIMNHGVSQDPRERSFFPLVEFRDAAHWFARRGYMVIAPVGPGYGGGGLDLPERGLYGLFFSHIGNCDNPNFLGTGLAVATVDNWIIEYMTRQKLIVPDKVVAVGQSAGGWAVIALSSLNPASVRAMITFAAGRGGRVGGKPNNNCAPDKLVAAAPSSAAPPASPCSGSTRPMILSSDQNYPKRCIRHSPYTANSGHTYHPSLTMPNPRYTRAKIANPGTMMFRRPTRSDATPAGNDAAV